MSAAPRQQRGTSALSFSGHFSPLLCPSPRFRVLKDLPFELDDISRTCSETISELSMGSTSLVVFTRSTSPTIAISHNFEASIPSAGIPRAEESSFKHYPDPFLKASDNCLQLEEIVCAPDLQADNQRTRSKFDPEYFYYLHYMDKNRITEYQLLGSEDPANQSSLLPVPNTISPKGKIGHDGLCNRPHWQLQCGPILAPKPSYTSQQKLRQIRKLEQIAEQHLQDNSQDIDH
ncbi:hypothetical protein C8R42DRAFT_642421 [Lentinula raphanica]|nr:hypothetical protein C8R42DRAFT_642421 [Lentinula raphanica]